MIFYILFWLSLFLLCYHVIFYGFFLYSVNLISSKKINTKGERPNNNLPSITVICAAYNEEADIDDKIKSFIALNYPPDKIKMVVISDDSTDATNSIVQEYAGSNIELIIQKPRRGKQCAHNLVQPTITTDYVLSTDANSIFAPDAVNKLVEAIQSNSGVGIVSGELKLKKKGTKDSGEGLYWKYESFLKKMDSAFASIIGANGSIFLIKRELFGQINSNSCDDFERTLFVLSKGYKALYVPEACVTEFVTEQAKEEINRKIRIITTEWFALKRNLTLLNPFRFNRITFILISHKIIRWLFFLFMILILVSSAIIPNPFYRFVFYAQIIFYIIGLAEILAQNNNKHIRGTALIAYFSAMGWASLIAFIRFLCNKDMGIWNPVRK